MKRMVEKVYNKDLNAESWIYWSSNRVIGQNFFSYHLMTNNPNRSKPESILYHFIMNKCYSISIITDLKYCQLTRRIVNSISNLESSSAVQQLIH